MNEFTRKVSFKIEPLDREIARCSWCGDEIIDEEKDLCLDCFRIWKKEEFGTRTNYEERR